MQSPDEFDGWVLRGNPLAFSQERSPSCATPRRLLASPTHAIRGAPMNVLEFVALPHTRGIEYPRSGIQIAPQPAKECQFIPQFSLQRICLEEL